MPDPDSPDPFVFFSSPARPPVGRLAYHPSIPAAPCADASTSGGCRRLANARVLCDEVAEVAGYRVFGSPFTPPYFGAFQV